MTAPATLDVSLLNLVAHEMRAPIAIFKGYLAMLSEGSLSSIEAMEAIRVMESKAEELEGLAEILVTAARLESADMPQQHNVFDVISSARASAEGSAPSSQPRTRIRC